MPKGVVVEIPQKGGETIMTKVSLQRLALFQPLGYGNFKSTSMGKPMNPMGHGLIAEHVKDLLRKGHFFNLGRKAKAARLGRNGAKVSIAVIRERLGFFNDLNDTRFHGILVFNSLETGLANFDLMLLLLLLLLF